MTEPSTPDGPTPPTPATSSPSSTAPPSAPDPTPPTVATDSTATTPARTLGLTTFTIEGRRAPALFVVGWLAVIAAAGLASLALFGGGGTAGTVFWLLAFTAASVGLILLGGSQSLERRAAGAAYAGPSPMLVLLAAVTMTQVAGFAVGLPLQAVGASVSRPVGDLIAVAIQALVFVAVIRLMVVGAGALTWREMGVVPGRRSALRSALSGAVYAGPVIFVTTLLALAAVTVTGVVPDSPLPPTGTAAGLLAHLVAGALIAPMAEELLFRGFVLTAWQRTVGTRAAILRSSIVFVLAHVLLVGGDRFEDALKLAFVAGVVRIPVALALGWLFVRTGSLWASIGLHAAFNGILITLAELGANAV
ncbi:MAG TPA: type II CAAX endopeptidase family protein [Candidatus Limnocylindrales bacterium]|nr:type II CAAX endopeptidase family protein [Candidatus Limnocylindrales bacterium]